MSLRISTAIIFVIIMVPFIVMGSWPLLLLTLFLAYRCLYELHRMKQIKFVSFPSLIAYLGITGVVLMDQILSVSSEYFQANHYIAFITLLILISATVDREYSYYDATVSLLGILYIGFGFYSMYHIRETSLALLLFIVLCIWATDVGAYLVGKAIGKRKLAPMISPNKTIEGSAGGVLCAMLIAYIFQLFLPFPYSILKVILLAGLISISGQFGDLIESGIKREFRVKDSGSILPGHGGILDRFDSLIFALSLCTLIGLG